MVPFISTNNIFHRSFWCALPIFAKGYHHLWYPSQKDRLYHGVSYGIPYGIYPL